MNYKQIIDEFSEFVNEKRQSIPYNFNILDEQCGHIVENSHTNILMKLLGYKNHHGYEFLSKFFDYIGWDLKVDSTKGVKIVTEKSITGGGRIDGYILQEGKFVIIIENKINGAPNQDDQIKKYVEDVLKERREEIWVVFLTKDGQNNPDNNSLECMKEYGIINSYSLENNDFYIEGPRYAALNYNEHILPWLKNVIQPCVMQKEVVLNTGLIQYIDFLEGFLGIRKSDAELMEEYKNKLKELLDLEVHKATGNYSEYYRILYNIKREQRELKKLENNKEDYQQIINIIDNILNELIDEPLKAFYNFTKEYFEDKLGMKDCIIRHSDKNLKYIQIRDASWPIKIHFEWEPLSIFEKMTSAFYFHDERSKNLIEKNHLVDVKGERGIKQFGDRKETGPILQMKETDLKNFLYKYYDKIGPDFIEKINEILSKS